MTETTPSTHSIALRELAAVRVACLDCSINIQTDDFGAIIRQGFNDVKAWVQAQGQDTNHLLFIGVMQPALGVVQHYECCVELPVSVQIPSGDINIKTLAGGNYVVLSVEKDDAAIRKGIEELQLNYIPQQQIVLDHTRATYEIYFENTMGFCVPIV